MCSTSEQIRTESDPSPVPKRFPSHRNSPSKTIDENKRGYPELKDDVGLAWLNLGLYIDRLEARGFTGLDDMKQAYLRLEKYLGIKIPKKLPENIVPKWRYKNC